MRKDFKGGDWTAAPSRNLLVRGDEPVRVEPRVMDVLVHLADHAEQMVSKEDLIGSSTACRGSGARSTTPPRSMRCDSP